MKDGHHDLASVVPLVERVVRARVRDPRQCEDLVQETLARLAAREDRLEPATLGPYAAVTARNLVWSHLRDGERRHRLRHRFHDGRAPAGPDEAVLQREEQAAVSVAVGRLREGERDVLLAHEVDGATTAELAEAHGTSAGAIGVRLAATRAKLRVEYLLAFRRVDPPTARCRPVLIALSAGDGRRQRALGAGQHLLDCRVCADLSDALLERRRALAGIIPLGLLGELVWKGKAVVRQHPVQSAVAASAAGGILVAGGVLLSGGGADAPPTVAAAPVTTTSTAAVATELTVEGRPLALTPGTNLSPHAGKAVRAEGAVVESVPVDEGFWLGDGGAGRVWVQLATEGESPAVVQAGQRVWFEGIVTANRPDMAAAVGLEPERGSDLLGAQGHHLAVPAAGLLLG